MGVLGNVLRSAGAYEPDMIVYVPLVDDVNLFTNVLIVQHGARPTPMQALRAVVYYAENDAFPDVSDIR